MLTTSSPRGTLARTTVRGEGAAARQPVMVDGAAYRIERVDPADPATAFWAHPGACASASGSLRWTAPDGVSIRALDPLGRRSTVRVDVVEAHGLAATADEGLWIADPGRKARADGPDIARRIEQAGTVVRVDAHGTRILTLDDPDARHDADAGWRPSGVAVHDFGRRSDGRVWVADGYGRSRVHCFTAGGDLVFSTDGSDSGVAFDTPHGVVIDERGDSPRLLVADRGNARIVALDLDGAFLETIGVGELTSPSGLAVHGSQLWVTELFGAIRVLDASDRIVATIGDPRRRDEPAWPNDLAVGVVTRPAVPEAGLRAPHGIAIAPDGTVLVTEWVVGGRVTRLVPAHVRPVAERTAAEIVELLGGVADRARHWLRTRRAPDGVGFGLAEGALEPVELNATTGGIELWVMLGLPLSDEERTRWVSHLSGYQREDTGLVADPTWAGRQLSPNEAQLHEGDTFFTMTAAAALDALDARLPFAVRYLADRSVDELAELLDWEWIAHTPRGVGDFGPLVRHNAALGVPGAAAQAEWIERMLVDAQDAGGFWPRGVVASPLTPHINRAFHVLRASWNLSGRRIERADLLIDACLAAAGDPDFYSWETGFACNDLDLAHVAYSAAAWSDHRREELSAWARGTLASILAVEKPGGGFSFHHETIMSEHAGIRVSDGRAGADTWGTLMYLGTIKMLVQLGWPEVRAPWTFSRVHAVPEPEGRR